MGPFQPYAIGHRPGGHRQLRQKPYGLFGEPAWNSLAEYRKTRGVDSEMPPGMPSDVTRIDHARPRDATLGYEPMPAGQKTAGAGQFLGQLAGKIGTGIRGIPAKVRGMPAAAQTARRESVQAALGVRPNPMPVPPVLPPGSPVRYHGKDFGHVDPDAGDIKTLFSLTPFGARARDFYAKWGPNRTVANTPENRLKYVWEPQANQPTAFNLAQAGHENEALRFLTNRPMDPTVRMPPPRPPMADAPFPLQEWAPSGLKVPRTNFRLLEGLGLLGGGTAIGGGLYGAHRAGLLNPLENAASNLTSSSPSAVLDYWTNGAGVTGGLRNAVNSMKGQPFAGQGYGVPPELSGMTPTAPAQPTAAPGTPNQSVGAAVPTTTGTKPTSNPLPLGDWANTAYQHIKGHPWQYGLGAGALGLGGLYLWNQRRREEEEERAREQELEDAYREKGGSADSLAATVRGCPTAAGILAYCDRAGYNEAEIRHTVIKAAGVVPALAGEFERLFGAAAGSFERATDGVTPLRIKRAEGEGTPAPRLPAQPQQPSLLGRLGRSAFGAAVASNPVASAASATHQLMTNPAIQGGLGRAWNATKGLAYGVGGTFGGAAGSAAEATANIGNRLGLVGDSTRNALQAGANTYWQGAGAGFRDVGRAFTPQGNVGAHSAINQMYATNREQLLDPGRADQSFLGLSPHVQDWATWAADQGAGFASNLTGGALMGRGLAAGARVGQRAFAGVPGMTARVAREGAGALGETAQQGWSAIRGALRPGANAYEAWADAHPALHQVAAWTAWPTGIGAVGAGGYYGYDRLINEPRRQEYTANPPTEGVRGQYYQAMSNQALAELKASGKMTPGELAEAEKQVRGNIATEAATAAPAVLSEKLTGMGVTPMAPLVENTDVKDWATKYSNPEVAPQLRQNASLALDQFQRTITANEGVIDPNKAYPQLVPIFRTLMASKFAESGGKEAPQDVMQRVLADNQVTPREIEQVANDPGLMGGQGAGAPIQDRFNQAVSFFKNPQVDGGTKLLAAIGVPLTIIGVLSTLFGGGLPGILMSALGMGATAMFGQQSGALQGTSLGGMMDAATGLFGGAAAGAAGGTGTPPAGTQAPGVQAPGAVQGAGIPGDTNRDNQLSAEEGAAALSDPATRAALVRLPVGQRAQILAAHLPNLNGLQQVGLDRAYATYAQGDQQGAAASLAGMAGYQPTEALALLQAYDQIKRGGT